MFFSNYSATFGYGRYDFIVTVRTPNKLSIRKTVGNQAKLRRSLIVSVYLLVLY